MFYFLIKEHCLHAPIWYRVAKYSLIQIMKTCFDYGFTLFIFLYFSYSDSEPYKSLEYRIGYE